MYNNPKSKENEKTKKHMKKPKSNNKNHRNLFIQLYLKMEKV